jgi:hypothetical protein
VHDILVRSLAEGRGGTEQQTVSDDKASALSCNACVLMRTDIISSRFLTRVQEDEKGGRATGQGGLARTRGVIRFTHELCDVANSQRVERCRVGRPCEL